MAEKKARPRRLDEHLGPPGHRTPEPPVHDSDPFAAPLAPGRAGLGAQSTEKYPADDQQRTTEESDAAQKNTIAPKLARP